MIPTKAITKKFKRGEMAKYKKLYSSFRREIMSLGFAKNHIVVRVIARNLALLAIWNERK